MASYYILRAGVRPSMAKNPLLQADPDIEAADESKDIRSSETTQKKD
jgi:hypothetical protein